MDNERLCQESIKPQAILSIIVKALDMLQSDSCIVGQTLEIWFDVMESKELCSYKDCIKHWFEEALTPINFIVNIIDPALQGKRLRRQQESLAGQFIERNESCLWCLNQDVSNKKYRLLSWMFSQNVNESFETKKWWKLMGNWKKNYL